MLSLDGKAVFYDATLQGGIIQRGRSVYTINSDGVCRGVLVGRLSAGISFKWFQVEAEQVFLTPEIKTGRKHMWSRIKTSFKI
jgi:hypothetical protein